MIKIVKKKLPSVFPCPKCGEETVRVFREKGAGEAVVRCASCGEKETYSVTATSQPVDIYCMFADKFHASEVRESAPQQTGEVETQSEAT